MTEMTPVYTDAFWQTLDQLVAGSEIVIDSPQGSVHPRYDDLLYPMDYGYLAGTTASDGGGIDVWVGSAERRQVVGIVCTLDLLKRDMEIKILIGCTATEIEHVGAFVERTRMGHLLVKRQVFSSSEK